ncbi:MAG: permease [Geminicoccaceae bacterium]|nr:permease [Geminicoccaceae bacterium]
MTVDQAIVFAIIGGALLLFVSNLWRFDLVAIGALLAGVLTGVVPQDRAFSGFSNPAVITVVAVLIISRALATSGVVDLIAARLTTLATSQLGQLLALSITGAVLSAFMNNVGALALLMPVALANARKFKYPAAAVLMPLSFATLLGGLITLIGTPPNLLIADFRLDASGERFRMFDFAPVGIPIAAAGIAFIALVGWRLIPHDRQGRDDEALFEISSYVSELRVTAKSAAIGQSVVEFEHAIEDGITVLAIIRDPDRAVAGVRLERLRAGDILIVQGDTSALEQAVKSAGLELVADAVDLAGIDRDELAFAEAVVTPDAWIRGSTPATLRLRRRYAVNLIAVSRQGRPFRGRIGAVRLNAGDVLLLQGEADRLPEVIGALGCLPLASRRLTLEPRRLLLPLAIFGSAIALTALDVLSAAVAFASAALLLVLTRALAPRAVYESVDWPVIVLLGAMIPVGGALESTGAAQLLAGLLFELTGELAPRLVLGAVLLLTMLLTPLLNNAATVVIMAPIVIGIARQLGISADPFLMAVAIGASCDFLTPIGHQNNTLIMGPGGYRFGDFWRLGICMDVLVLAVAVLLIPVVWPF